MQSKFLWTFPPASHPCCFATTADAISTVISFRCGHSHRNRCLREARSALLSLCLSQGGPVVAVLEPIGSKVCNLDRLQGWTDIEVCGTAVLSKRLLSVRAHLQLCPCALFVGHYSVYLKRIRRTSWANSQASSDIQWNWDRNPIPLAGPLTFSEGERSQKW